MSHWSTRVRATRPLPRRHRDGPVGTADDAEFDDEPDFPDEPPRWAECPTEPKDMP